MKYKILYISPEFLVRIFSQDAFRIKVTNPLPEDSKYIRSFTDDTTGWGRIGIVIESESFTELKEEDLIPTIPYPMFEKE